ncbi:nitroreductase/quinone reductase family protein, partial [Streptomyces minutiscleroticus]|uniref:nitroreductase/quinone reductase family protein n=1 Tax=Streptomyces minutiscleroticus TaxID=68238 RepID=UPI00331B723C
SPDGELAAAYRKIHRFGFDKGEAVLVAAFPDYADYQKKTDREIPVFVLERAAEGH